MRFDFRVKVDLTEVIDGSQQHSWVFVDSTKIFLIKDLKNHLKQLFKISKPFHLFSKSDGELYTLPSIEDVRVLQNNDTILVVPGAGPEEFTTDKQCNFQDRPKEKKPMTLDELVQEYANESQIEENDKPKDSSVAILDDLMFHTAVFDQSINNSVVQINDSFGEPSDTKKRKRIRTKNKNKKAKNTIDCEMSLMDISHRPVAKTVHSSVKHIRFGDEAEDSINQVKGSEEFSSFDQGLVPTKLETKKEFKETSKEVGVDECIAFKILKLDNYTPTVSKEITARILKIDEKKSEYTMKILYGQDQLKISNGKFALPSEKQKQDYEDEVVTFEKAQLIDLRKLC